uniref:Aminotransferase-like plant mobile domain-containing protein n=1 Tax=Setaria italica TaxID=4555 RepID=K3YL96_SETIT
MTWMLTWHQPKLHRVKADFVSLFPLLSFDISPPDARRSPRPPAAPPRPPTASPRPPLPAAPPRPSAAPPCARRTGPPPLATGRRARCPCPLREGHRSPRFPSRLPGRLAQGTAAPGRLAQGAAAAPPRLHAARPLQDMLVHTCSPHFMPFWDPREWPPYDGPKYIVDPTYHWNKCGSRIRTRHMMVMYKIPGRTRYGRATPFLTDPEQNECNKCGRLGQNSRTCHWQISEVRLVVRCGLPKFNSAAMIGAIFNHCCRWRPETRTFHLAFREMTVTLEDCQKMLGLTIRSDVVTGPCRSDGWRARVAVFLGREVDEQGVRTSGVLIFWLRQQFAQCPEDADEQIVWNYCRAWILHLFACVLFPDATSDTASWMWIHCLTDWHQAVVDVGPSVGRPEVLSHREWFPGQPPRRQPTWAYLWDRLRVPHTRLERAYRDFTNELDTLTTLDRKKNRKVFEWHVYHQPYIEQWEEFHDNVDENNKPHTNSEYRRYQAWYQGATHCRLRLQWTQDDYGDIESSDDEDTAYDQSTCVGRQGHTLKSSIEDIERFHPRVRDDETYSFLERLSCRLRRAAARCGCRTATTRDVHVPSPGRGGIGSSSQAATQAKGIAYEDEDNDERHEELGLSQLHDAPLTQPTQPTGTRRCRPPSLYTPGTDTLGHKGKGKTRRQ